MPRRQSTLDLEVLPTDGGDSGPPYHPADDGRGPAPKPPRPALASTLLVLFAIAFVVANIMVGHLRRQASTLRAELSLARETAPNLGQIAYDGGGVFDLPSADGIRLTAAVSLVKINRQPAESVWVSVRAVGLPAGIEFDLETQSCDGEIGYSLDRGGMDADNATLYQTEKLGLPPLGHSYNVVLRRYRGAPIGGITISGNKVLAPMKLGSRGC